MNLSDLLVFRTVVEEGGILRAARKLHRVQSSITTRIKVLEASLGAELFFREKQRLVLSPRGESFLVYADQILRLADEARNAVSGSAPSGVFRLGSLESTAASRLPPILARFHKAFPDVQVELRTGTNDALTAAVKDRSLDAAFVAEPPADRALSHLPLFREKLVLISSTRHRPISGPAAVATDSVISFPNGCAYRRVLERWLGRNRMSTLRVLELSSYHAIVACVSAGTGVALMPESVLDTLPATSISRHALPKSYSEILTPLIWRSTESSPCVSALRELVGGDRKATG